MKKPSVFGKYLLLERINVGGMAEVFIAKAFGVEGFERILAIKKILPTMAEDREFITMFIDEARISVQLNHANVVQIHELGKFEETYFIAMEYVAGKDLRTILERYRRRKELMPVPQAVYVASKMCEGLDYAHRKKDAKGQDLGIIHRDVSPQNILCSYEGEVKIIDFGIAKAANRSQKTQAGILKGKFGYMSPEQVRGMPIDRRSDLFAVGVILYELLTGEKLFVGESDFSTLEKVRNAEVPLPRTLNPDISAGLEKVVLKALAREPEDRYQWASDLQEDLMRFLVSDDAIYSAKQLSAFMKEAFAEELLREEEKMERYAAIERPDQLLDTSGGDRPRGGRNKNTAASSAQRAATPPPREQAAPAPRALEPPPPHLEDEDDDWVDKTLLAPELAGGPGGVLSALRASLDSPPASTGRFDAARSDEDTSRSANLLEETGKGASAQEETGAGANPLTDGPTGITAYPAEDGSISGSEDLPTDAGVAGRARAGNRPQVVIGEATGYAGETVIGVVPATGSGAASRSAPNLGPEPRTDGRSPGARGRAQQAADVAEQPTGPRMRSGGRADAPRVGSGPKHAPERRRMPLLVGGALGALLCVVLGIVMLSRKSPGVLVVASPAEATITVGGQKVVNNTVTPLPPGEYDIAASAPGYKPFKQTVKVEAGESPRVVSIELTPEPSSQKGDGRTAQQEPPREPRSTSPPENGDGKGEAGDPSKGPERPADPVATTFVARFVGPEGAEVKVDDDIIGLTPNAEAADLVVGKVYHYTAELEGYRPVEGSFTSDGKPEVEIKLDMEKVVEKPVSPPRGAPPEEPSVRPVVKKPPVRSRKRGKLACSSNPAGAEVFVDGRPTGRQTPVPLGNPLELSVGTHKVVFKLAGKTSAPQIVDIKENEVATLRNVAIE